ncbi:hypothetical protein OBBRIDRAFT_529862 [Obba rivulosa]|uniref:C3H1-type domain-containing protein n=1 Tax=Obba rivulosa TaxID=1052685 RepID=A0A8E2AVH5_9APHY|nr:hypothetical protein OBBRIDRAFT_529862 [Obba rivulosa]
MAQDMAFFSRPSPSAVKISAPSADEPPSSPKPKKDSTQRQCRNILIYGSCKFQDKGCIYYHPSVSVMSCRSSALLTPRSARPRRRCKPILHSLSVACNTMIALQNLRCRPQHSQRRP